MSVKSISIELRTNITKVRRYQIFLLMNYEAALIHTEYPVIHPVVP